MSSTSNVSFQPSLLLEGINLARRAITKFTNGLDSLATEVTSFIGKTGNDEKNLADLSSKNRALAISMLARDLNPEQEFITQPTSTKVSRGDFTNDQKKIAEYLHGFYSTKQATGTKKPTQFRELFHKLNLGDFSGEELQKQVTNFKGLIEKQNAFLKDTKLEDPLPGINLGGVKAGSSQESGERRNILFTEDFFQTLKDKFRDGSNDTDLSKLKEYKLAVVDFLLGSVARYYDGVDNRRTVSVTNNLNAPNGHLSTLVKSIDYFLKLK